MYIESWYPPPFFFCIKFSHVINYIKTAVGVQPINEENNNNPSNSNANNENTTTNQQTNTENSENNNQTSNTQNSAN